MSFVDFWFYPAVLLLFILTAGIHWLFRNRPDRANTVCKSLLLLFSYLTMYWYDYRFCICITAVILTVYLLAPVIEKAWGKRRTAVTVIAVTALLAVLGYFKYLNFFLGTAMSVLGRPWKNLEIILPVGISFYIFSAVGYVLDVSWGSLQADRSLLDVALFLSFFPKQVCGPIVSGRDFLPQLKENRRPSWSSAAAGAQIFLFGLFKKIVIADHLAVFVDDVYALPAVYGTATVWLAVFSAFLQLYFDFSGYSDMAAGISKIFGYELQRNFNVPFAARNISEFWDRWHISLSAWLNEYLFNPVALQMKRAVAKWPKEKRKKYKMLPTCTAVMVTFLLSGLWHGAGFTFLVWGLCHGVYSVCHALFSEWVKSSRKVLPEKTRGCRTALYILANYFTVNLIQVFFRADSIGQAFYIYKRMFLPQAGIEQPYTWAAFAFLLLAAATFIAFWRSRRAGAKDIQGFYPLVKLDTVAGLTLFFVCCGLTLMLGYFGQTYFIYGRF